MACLIELIDPRKNTSVKQVILDEIYTFCEIEVNKRNEALNRKPNKRELFWKITNINV